MQPQLASLPGKATSLLALQREAKLADDVVTALRQKLNDANISKATALSDVTVTAPASPREATQRPDLMLNLAIGAFSSLILGVVVTLLVFVFDRRIRDESQIEDELELPVLASVPQLGALQRLPERGQLAVGTSDLRRGRRAVAALVRDRVVPPARDIAALQCGGRQANALHHGDESVAR